MRIHLVPIFALAAALAACGGRDAGEPEMPDATATGNPSAQTPGAATDTAAHRPGQPTTP